MSLRLTLTAVAVLVFMALPVRASEQLRNEVRTSIAEPIQKLLVEEKQTAISIGEFTGPAQLDTNAGPWF